MVVVTAEHTQTYLFIEVETIIDSCSYISGHLGPWDEITSSISARVLLKGRRSLCHYDDLLDILVVHFIILRGVWQTTANRVDND